MRTNQNGFTLIELLVVVAIVGILSSIVLISLSQAKQKAQVNRVTADLRTINSAIHSKRSETGKVLKDITGSTCSGCQCGQYPGPQTKATVNSSSCLTRMKTTFQAIGFADVVRDPWGDTYLLDENEGDTSAQNPCRNDGIYSYMNGGSKKSISIETFAC